MRKKRLFTTAALLILGLAAPVLLWGRRPFRELRAGDIAVASVCLVPPDVTVPLERAEIEALAELLREVRVTRRDDGYTAYSGQAVTFALTMADGNVTEVTAYTPFLIIDGVGYRTAYAPCEALSRFANGLLTS